MSEPTCVIPIGWTLGQACVALCDRRTETGVDQRAKFNWVMLDAGPDADPEAMARAYWREVAGLSPDHAPPVLTGPALATGRARRVQAAADAVRQSLNQGRAA